MGIIYSSKRIHWNLFVALEREFETVARYIEPCTENDNTYSIELARLLMSAAQEVDVVLKAYCEILNGDSTATKEPAYFATISEHKPEFLNVEVEIAHYGMQSQPYIDWNAGKAPIWWTANNKVKHQRRDFFNRATLKNTYNAIAALEIAIIHLFKAELEVAGEKSEWSDVTALLIPKPSLFVPKNGYYLDSVPAGTF